MGRMQHITAFVSPTTHYHKYVCEADWESLSMLSQIICFKSVMWRTSLKKGKYFSFIFHFFTIIYSKSKVAAKNRRSLLYFVTIGKKLRNVCYPLPLT